jgi:hypothetical protein
MTFSKETSEMAGSFLIEFGIGLCICDHGFQPLVLLENGVVGSMKRTGRIDLFLESQDIAPDNGQRIPDLMGDASDHFQITLGRSRHIRMGLNEDTKVHQFVQRGGHAVQVCKRHFFLGRFVKELPHEGIPKIDKPLVNVELHVAESASPQHPQDPGRNGLREDQFIPLLPELLEMRPALFMIQDDPGLFDLPEIPEEFLGKAMFPFQEDGSVFDEALLLAVSEAEFFLKPA